MSIHRHMHANKHPHHHAHAHHRHAYAYSVSDLTAKHWDDTIDEKLGAPVPPEEDPASALAVAHARAGGEHAPSITSEKAMEHRMAMNLHFTSLYTQEILTESRLDANLVWGKSVSGQVSIDDVLSANSALPADLQTH